MIFASEIYKNIERECCVAGKEGKLITVVAATKKQSVEKINEYIEYCRDTNKRIVIGENYVQEWREKSQSISLDGVESHLIGPLQSNKVKDAVELFDVIESVHSLELAQKIGAAASKLGKTTGIYLQVNISNDSAKSGLTKDSVPQVYAEAKKISGITVQGLMTITQLYDNPEDARKDFKEMKTLADTLDSHLYLSMGMSDDYIYAIQEGATHVRIGSALFGVRS